MNKVRVGLIGTGFIGPVHIEAIHRTGLAEVVALAELNESTAKAKAEALDSTKLDEAVNARIELYKNAEKAGVEVKNDMKDADIKKAVIAKVFPKANLDGKDSAYIDARYDATVEMLAERADSNSRQVLADTPNNHADSVDDARQRMIDKMKKDSRHEQEEK